MKKRLHNVLILNLGWTPVHIVDWQKAITLIYNCKVKCLDGEYVGYEYNDWCEFSKHTKNYTVLKSANSAIAIPEIAVLKTYTRLRPDKGIKFSRQNVITRDGNLCAYCGRIFPTKELTLDHILPVSRGGKTIWSNIISACKKCNNIKANRTPEECGMPLLFKPKKPEWTNGGKISGFCEFPSWERFMNHVESKPEYNQDPDSE